MVFNVLGYPNYKRRFLWIIPRQFETTPLITGWNFRRREDGLLYKE